MINDDYITRGLFYLIGWFIFGWPVMAFIGALIAGAGGAAVGFFLAIPLGIWGYHLYLTRQGKRALNEYSRRLFR
jgi:hypothetical protein